MVLPCGRKSEAAVAKARTFEIMFIAVGRGVDGYAKPNNAQIAKKKNMPARRKSVYLDSLIAGESVSRVTLEISTRKIASLTSKGYNDIGPGTYMCGTKMRLKGNSKIDSAAMIPMIALPAASQIPRRCTMYVRYSITKKVTTAEIMVTGVTGFAGIVI